jgi:3-oxoacyl-[acyl-carrier protein] reductase
VGRVQDRVAVVTGAGNGIGRAIALRLAEEGALVVGGDVDRDALDRTVSAITASGGTAIGVLGDLTEAGRRRRSWTRPSSVSDGWRSW